MKKTYCEKCSIDMEHGLFGGSKKRLRHRKSAVNGKIQTQRMVK